MEPLLRHCFSSSAATAIAASAVTAVAIAVRGITDPSAATATPQEPTDPGNDGLDERLDCRIAEVRCRMEKRRCDAVTDHRGLLLALLH